MKIVLQNAIALIFLTSLALLWPSRATAQEPVILTDEQDSYPLGLHVATLHDPNGELTLAQVRSPAYAAKFVPSHEATPNFGFHTTGWVRLQVINQSHQSWWLTYSYSNMQELDYYVFGPDQTLLEHVATGSARPFAQRQIPNHRFVFAPKFQPNEIYTIYLRLGGHYSIPVLLTLESLAAWGEANGWENLLYGFFFGTLFIMLGYNFILFIFLGEISYLYFVTFLAFFILSQHQGFGDYVWSDLVWWNYKRVAISTLGDMVSILLFSHSFLEVKLTFPRLSRLIYFHIGFLGVMGSLFIFDITYRFLTITLVGAALVPVVVFGIALWAWFHGHRAARYLLWAWVVFGFAQVVNLLPTITSFPSSVWTEHGHQIGVVLMVLLLSLALADRINLLKAETEQANQKLHESENRLKQFLEALPVGVVVFHVNKLLSYINQRAYELFHLTPTVQDINISFAETLMKLPRYVAQTNQPYPLEKLPLTQAFEGQTSYVDDLEVQTNQQRRQLEIWGQPIFDSSGQVEYAMSAFQDITKRKQNEAELLHYQVHLEQLVAARTEELNRVNAELDRLAHVDGLTHIANRRRFDQYLRQAWQSMAQAQLPLSLILCDIDYFKLYNDTYGHQMGDDCLRQVAQAFTASIKRSTDLVARYGGEEFVLVLPRTDAAGAKIVAGYLHERIQQLQIPHAASQCSQYITISLGVTTIIPTLEQSSNSLVSAADAALYQAKLQGRNRTVSQMVGE